MIISCSWHGATSARLWYTSCSYPKICHNSLCPLFQECSISCILMRHEFSCCGIAATCVAAIVTAWMNQQNTSDANLRCVSTAWFFLVSLLLPECNFVCLFLYGHYFRSQFGNLASILKGTTQCKLIFSMHKCLYLQNSEPGLFNLTCREINTGCKVPTLQIVPHRYLEWWLDVVK